MINDRGNYPEFKYNYHISIVGVQVDKNKNYSILYGDTLPTGYGQTYAAPLLFTGLHA